MPCRMQHRVLLNVKLVANPQHGILPNTHDCNHYQSTYTSYYNDIIWFSNVAKLGGPMNITRLCSINVNMILFEYNVLLDSSVLVLPMSRCSQSMPNMLQNLYLEAIFYKNPSKTSCPTQELPSPFYFALWNMVKKFNNVMGNELTHVHYCPSPQT